ncbi:MAG: glycosyltransferase family 4 protein [Microgenomates group bacterium]
MTSSKKALIVSPYLDHLGGGERYMLSAAAALESLGYDIYFSWDNLEEITKLSSMLGITLKNPRLDANIKKLYFSNNPADMYLSTRKYDVVFYLSDGSIPLLGGRRNIVHMQVPFHGIGGKSLKNRIKKLFIHQVVVNSQFTKNVIDAEYGINSIVLYPPVVPITDSLPKEKIILSVGRFEPSLNTKHQDVLIDAFKMLSPKLPEWKLIMAGGCSSDQWLKVLKQKATGLPIEFATNVEYSQLTQLYQKASIYWHAAGYGVDEVKNPELTEHFGISTVEAISAGAAPLVVPYGGQREIVKDSNYHWETKEQLIAKTLALVDNLKQPVINTEIYSVDRFKQQLASVV